MTCLYNKPCWDGLGARVAKRALSLSGTRFRLHGRSAEQGVDCVGLAYLAALAGGFGGQVPTGYSMRGGDAARFAKMVDDLGLRRISKNKPHEDGDIILLEAGDLQFHIVIVASVGGVDGYVHADAGLGRVTFVPEPITWPTVGIWQVC